jgi:CRP/FNR family transcriptional regulator, anaerobic regulatory protein
MPVQAISSLPSNGSRVVALRAVPVVGVSEPLGALPAEVATIVTRVAGCKRRVRQGDFLFRSGAQFHHLFVVRAGMFKTILIDPQGREQVTGFQMAGEVLGLDGIETEHFQSSAVALEDSEVWEIPFSRLEALCRQDGAMQRTFHRLMSREIQRDYLMMLLLGSMSAEERLAAFLVNLSQRLTERGYSPVRFVLRMSRREIGSYLGLTLETVSRVFSRFHREGFIRAELKAVELKDFERLRALVGIAVPRVA